jgi:hypothetical protein
MDDQLRRAVVAGLKTMLAVLEEPGAGDDAHSVASAELTPMEVRLAEAARATVRPGWVPTLRQPAERVARAAIKRARVRALAGGEPATASAAPREARVHLRVFAERIGVKYATAKQWRAHGMPCSRGKVLPHRALAWIEQNRKNSVAINRKSVVYFVRDQAGRIKIGLSSNVQRRLLEIRKMVKGPVALLGTIDGDMRTELALHERFAADRLEGEWFRASEAVMAAVPTMVAT